MLHKIASFLTSRCHNVNVFNANTPTYMTHMLFQSRGPTKIYPLKSIPLLQSHSHSACTAVDASKKPQKDQSQESQSPGAYVKYFYYNYSPFPNTSTSGSGNYRCLSMSSSESIPKNHLLTENLGLSNFSALRLPNVKLENIEANNYHHAVPSRAFTSSLETISFASHLPRSLLHGFTFRHSSRFFLDWFFLNSLLTSPTPPPPLPPTIHIASPNSKFLHVQIIAPSLEEEGGWFSSLFSPSPRSEQHPSPTSFSTSSSPDSHMAPSDPVTRHTDTFFSALLKVIAFALAMTCIAMLVIVITSGSRFQASIRHPAFRIGSPWEFGGIDLADFGFHWRWFFTIVLLAYATRPDKAHFKNFYAEQCTRQAALAQDMSERMRARASPYLLEFKEWAYDPTEFFAIVRVKESTQYTHVYIGIFGRWFFLTQEETRQPRQPSN